MRHTFGPSAQGPTWRKETITAPAQQLLNPLDALARQVARRPDAVAFVQPQGGGKTREYTWRQIDDEARRMAFYLTTLDIPARSNIALMSKNCAEWILCDLAIWMAGHVSVPLYPTLAAQTVNQIMTHCGAPILFVGKLDTWHEMAPGVPAGVTRIAFSLAPDEARAAYPVWTDLVDQYRPLEDIA